MRNREVLTVDEDALLMEAEQVARRCAARAGLSLPRAHLTADAVPCLKSSPS